MNDCKRPAAVSLNALSVFANVLKMLFKMDLQRIGNALQRITTELSYLLHAKLHDFPQSLRVHFEKKNNPLSQFIKDHRHCQNCHMLHSHSVSSQFLRNLAAFSNSITVTLYLK